MARPHELTGSGIGMALTCRPRPTLNDLFNWARETNRPIGCQPAVEHVVGISGSDTLSEVSEHIERRVERELSKRDNRHWSFNPGRLRVMRELAAHIEAFEAA